MFNIGVGLLDSLNYKELRHKISDYTGFYAWIPASEDFVAMQKQGEGKRLYAIVGTSHQVSRTHRAKLLDMLEAFHPNFTYNSSSCHAYIGSGYWL